VWVDANVCLNHHVIARVCVCVCVCCCVDRYEQQVERLQLLLKEANENMAAGETQRSLELRQELLALEELYTKDTTQLRVRRIVQ